MEIYEIQTKVDYKEYKTIARLATEGAAIAFMHYISEHIYTGLITGVDHIWEDIETTFKDKMDGYRIIRYVLKGDTFEEDENYNE